jgi:ADP-heptose:LPS heptosyltransferase
MIINCDYKNFGGFIKMGDLVAVMNIFEYIREKLYNPTIKFYLPEESLQKDYNINVVKFKKILQETTDFFSETPGYANLEDIFELWSFRNDTYEKLILKNTSLQERKICIFPLLEVSYDIERKWSIELLHDIIDQYSQDVYLNYKKFICIEKESLLRDVDIKDFTVSTDFDENIQHVLTCSHFIGGATGFSHFASVLDDEKTLNYYYFDGMHGHWHSSVTQPFHVKYGKGNLILFTK